MDIDTFGIWLYDLLSESTNIVRELRVIEPEGATFAYVLGVVDADGAEVVIEVRRALRAAVQSANG